MNKELEQLTKASKLSSLVSIIGVIFAVSSLMFLFNKTLCLETSDKEISNEIMAQKNEIVFLKNEIENNNVTNVIPEQPQFIMQRKQQVRTFSQRNNHCEKSRPFYEKVRPSEGWKIDTNTITTNLNSLSSQSQFIGIENPTETGFDVRAELRNNGDCIKVFGNAVSKDGRGFVNVTVKFVEFREVRAN